MKALRVLAVAFLIVSLLAGCDASTKTGVFKEYEMKQAGTIDTPLSKMGFGDPRHIVEPTGNAIVTVGSEDLTATCTFEDLNPGDKVLIKRDESGAWSVAEKR